MFCFLIKKLDLGKQGQLSLIMSSFLLDKKINIMLLITLLLSPCQTESFQDAGCVKV
ncbi:hypothetical protein GMMP13_380032 [Candidatus Magnetomoraceae bacterium gMMP-13]